MPDDAVKQTILPFADLDPHLILDAIESVGMHCTGSLHALNSYENRVYQVGIEDAPPLIAKFYRPQRWSDETILEEHQFALDLASHEIPIVAPMFFDNNTLLTYKDFRFALFPRWSGRAITFDNTDQLTWMGRFIGRLHAIGAYRPFQHRPTLTIKSYGENAYEFLITQQFIPDYLKTNYCHTVEAIITLLKEIYQRTNPIHNIRLHGDLHIGNILWDDAGPHIVDLDDCLMGPAIQDFWMLLSGDEQARKPQLDAILSGYEEFHDFNDQEITLIEPLRTLRMLNYSAWLAARWQDPSFTRNFPWFNTPSYWEEQLRHLREQLELLQAIA